MSSTAARSSRWWARAEVYRRNERGLFELHDQTGREAVEFACVNFTLAMAEVFDGVEDTPAA
jgi:hypothetical protein